MNCMSGDKAEVTVGERAGLEVSVLFQAPHKPFTMPNGGRDPGCPPDHWVVESLGQPFVVQGTWGGSVTSQFIAIPDSVLRMVTRKPDATAPQALDTKPMMSVAEMIAALEKYPPTSMVYAYQGLRMSPEAGEDGLVIVDDQCEHIGFVYCPEHWGEN